MPVARLLRLLTIVLSFASLQLTLLAGGPGCAMPGDGAARPAGAQASMAGMASMPGDEMPRSAADVPCDQPAAPQACDTMAPCLFAALPPDAAADAPTALVQSRAIAARHAAPPFESPPPDLPPPRA
jgi:hypothetical protein